MPNRFSGGGLATVLVVSLVVTAPMVGYVAVTAAAPVEHSTYAVAQGTTCAVIDPVTNTSQNASDFYDYRNPYPSITGNPPSNSFSSFGTQEYQQTRGSVLLFYEGSEGASLVLVHDRLGGESDGSTLTMTFSGLPVAGEWAVKDDEYPDFDDDWEVQPGTTKVDWKWGDDNTTSPADGRTDGGVFRGIGNMSDTIVVEPAFNDAADHWGDWGRSGSDEYRLTSWTVVGADGTEHELDRDRRVFVHGGGCVESPPTASVDGPAGASPGESVTFDASNSTDDEALGGFEWDFDGDGVVDEVTTDAGVSHAFDATGNYTVEVTAFDRYGNGDTATTNVTVTQPSSPPNASLDVPSEATVNETVSLDASNSTDEGDIVQYRWDADGDGEHEVNTTDPVLEHTYNQTGTWTPLVTVVDDDGAVDSASAEVAVRGSNEPPTASLDAPESVTVNQSVTLDASNSSDDTGIDSYRWDFDGDGTVDNETAAASVTRTYAEPGNVTVAVTVVDTDNAKATASQNISVESVDDPPTATISGPANASANTSVSFDASNSTDDIGIDSYRWDFDGDGQIEANTSTPTSTFEYDAGGEYNATVTVVDTAGQSATASTTVLVTGPPMATLTAQTSVTVNETVTLDASGSHDDDPIASYRWDVDGDGVIDAETQDPVFQHAYAAAGPVEPTVTVVDTDNQTATASASIDVAAESGGGDGGDDGGDGSGGDDGNSGSGSESDDGGSGSSGGSSGGGGSNPSAGSSGGGGGSSSSTGGDAATNDDTSAQETTEEPDEANISGAEVTLSTDSLLVGESLVIEATVTNNGTARGVKTVELEIDDELLTEREIPLEANETRTITFTHEFDTPGVKAVKVDHQEKHLVTVNPLVPDINVTDVSVGSEPVTAGEPFEITGVIENTGHAEGTKEVQLVLFDEIVDAETVTLAAGESERVTFTREIQAAGTFEVSVGNATMTLDVAGQSTDATTTATATTDESSEGEAPGFDLMAVAVAIAVLSVVVLRRRR